MTTILPSLTTGSPPSAPPAETAEALIESCLAVLAPDLCGQWQDAVALPGETRRKPRCSLLLAARASAAVTSAATAGEIFWLCPEPADRVFGALAADCEGAQWTAGPGIKLTFCGHVEWYAMPRELGRDERLPWLACVLVCRFLHLPPTALQQWLLQKA